MPNWNYDNITIYSPTNDLDMIKKLRNDIKDALSDNPTKFNRPKNSWGKCWLGNIILENVPYNEDNKNNEFNFYYPRGSIIWWEDENNNESEIIHFDCEHAWDSWMPYLQLYLDNYYPGLKVVGLAEECGEQVYINTDIEHKFYMEKYQVEMLDDYYYLTSDQDLIKLFTKCFPEYQFKDLNSIYKFVEDYNKKKEEDELWDAIIRINEYELVSTETLISEMNLINKYKSTITLLDLLEEENNK